MEDKEQWTISFNVPKNTHYINRDNEEEMDSIIARWAASGQHGDRQGMHMTEKVAIIRHWANGWREYIPEEHYAVLDDFLHWTHLHSLLIVAVEIY